MRSTRKWLALLICVIAGLLTLALLPTARAQSTPQRCFPETGFCISRRILEFWEQNGGLAAFGYPITRLQQESIEGQLLQVQWFERNRLELHPENTAPYDVLLGQLGRQSAGQAAGQPRETPRAGCRFFAETGFNVCGDILAAWRANGLQLDGQPAVSEAESLALWGLPVSGEVSVTLADGKPYTVQFFERARFELHPENAVPYNVLPGLLGIEVKQPQLPGPDAEIVAAVRAFVDELDVPYTVEDICVDRAFALARPTPIIPSDPLPVVLKLEQGRWTVLGILPPVPPPDGSMPYGLPDDFTCLKRPK